MDVTPLEPNDLVRGRLTKRLGIQADARSFESFTCGDGAYDAIVDESVLYALDMRATFAKAHRLIRAGGLFAFSEMLWTDAAKPEVVAFIHDQTKEAFGLPMAPRDPTTLAAWDCALREAGFSELVATKVGAGEAHERHSARRRVRLALRLLRRPALVPIFIKYRSYQQLRWAPPGWLESRVGIWRRN